MNGDFGPVGHMILQLTDGSIRRTLLPPNNRSSFWYEAIQHLTNLDIRGAASQGNDEELKRVINDAVRTLRSLFRGKEGESLLVTHNEDYGFVRNFAGLRLVWLPASVVGAVVCWDGLCHDRSRLGLGYSCFRRAVSVPCSVSYPTGLRSPARPIGTLRAFSARWPYTTRLLKEFCHDPTQRDRLSFSDSC